MCRHSLSGCEFPGVSGTAGSLANGDAIGKVAHRSRLNQEIAEDRGLIRSGQDSAPGTIRRELVQQVVHRTAAYDMDVVRPSAGDRFKLLERVGVAHRKALEYEPGEGA